MNGIDEQILDLGSAHISTIAFGNKKGKPLFLLPGWPLSSTIFALLVPYLGDHFRVTSMDLPGWAGQSRFWGDHRNLVSDYVQIVEETIRTIYPGRKRLMLGGVSLGGTLAMLTAKRLGRKCKKVFIQSSPYNGHILYESRRMQFGLMKAAQPSAFLRKILKAYYKGYLVVNYGKFTGEVDKDVMKRLHRDYTGLHPEDVTAIALDLCSSDYTEIFRSLKTKVVVMGCEQDEFIDASDMHTLANEILPRARHIEMAGVGHYVLAEDTAQFAQIMKKYL